MDNPARVLFGPEIGSSAARLCASLVAGGFLVRSPPRPVPFCRMKQPMDFAQFLKTPEPANLGPEGRPGVMGREELERALQPALEATHLSPTRKRTIQSLLLLWHDHLDASHEISQSIENPDGAFVHGIMHRREPDFGNAGYWFRRVGRHPAFGPLVESVSAALHSASVETLANRLVPKGEWDPFGFIAACEEARRRPADILVLRNIQQLEFEALLAAISRETA